MSSAVHADDPEVPRPDSPTGVRPSDSGPAEPTHTSPAPRSQQWRAPESWGNLRVIDEIGAGAYGRVYRAWDPVLEREVALKVIRIEPFDRARAADVLREGQMLARVRHRNVVTVYGAQQIRDDIGMWMELVRGRSLSQMVRDDGPMGAAEAAVIGISLCDALAAVHAAGLLHRDIKAQNVVRESGGRIVLMDFGAGREAAVARQGWEDMSGTPLYMAPEVLAGEGWSQAADVYSLGVLLFFLVTGRYPVEGRSMADIAVAHGLGQRNLLIDLRPGLPEGFVRVVDRAIAGRAERRYRTAGALMRELAEAIPGSSGSGREEAGAVDVAERVRGASESGSTGAVPAQAASRDAARYAGAAAAMLAGVWLLGFLTSVAYDQTLGRPGDFSDESLLEWLIWGIRSLIGPALFMVLAMLAYRIARAVWRLIERVAPPVHRAAAAVRERRAAAAGALGLSNRTVRAQWYVGLHLAALAIVYWQFRGLIGAFTTFLSTAPAEALAELRPDNGEHVAYRMVLSVLLLAMCVAWWRLVAAPSASAPVEKPTLAAGLALLVVTLVMLDVPFRLVYQSLGERVQMAGERCYDIGQARGNLLLFCPGARPRTRIVNASDGRLRREGIVESIFTPAMPAAR